MNGRRWSVLSSKGQLSTARLLPRASICVWSAVWVGFSAESAMANLEPNRSGSANNVSMTSSWHTYSSSHNFVRPPSPAPILTGQAKLCEEGNNFHMSEIEFAKHINAEELAALALRLANTFSPAGHEQPLAEVVLGWFVQNGIPVRLQPILPDRANVVAALQGTGGGASLLFNSHLDTEVSGPEYDWGMAQPDINRTGAHREGNNLLGHTVLNDRGLMATTMITLKALRDSGIRLRGDVICTAVAGATGGAPVDAYQRAKCEGKGAGSRLLVPDR